MTKQGIPGKALQGVYTKIQLEFLQTKVLIVNGIA